MRDLFRRLYVTALIVLSSQGVVSGMAYGQQPTTINASYNGTAGFNLPIWVLESTDIGRKYGFNVKTSLVGGRKAFTL